MEKHEQLFVSIRKIIRAIDIRSRKLSKEAGVTGPQLLVLQELARVKGITAKEVATEVNLSQATVTNILDRLESRGVVERVRSEKDKRRVSLFLTEEGKAILINAPQAIEDTFIQRFSALQEWEQLQLMSSVERIADMLGASHLDAAPVLNLGELTKSPE
ncbi:MarR family transcriptional regulator [Alteromonas sp. KUL49]|uniref:MarR family winged helix-turn-helix transcriptional regulator n=1 Tax=Alteromonas sp. KUL49 TaxID=2480798 RepID=UPI00102F0EC8|nr:MarR family transcriptional regulator [Alteromonas sp. KUL49]TAP39275.1 MarR family transcriptional regulator [Alteromonas sp. KUL49]GEA12057.1 MarR family transcriptional regulator [Alteromonas sp. KUL49]